MQTFVFLCKLEKTPYQTRPTSVARARRYMCARTRLFGGDRTSSRHHPASPKLLSSSLPLAARRSPLAHGVLGTTHAWTDGQIRCPASPPVPPPAQSLAPGKRTLKPWSPCPCSKHPEPQKILPWRFALGVELPLGHSVG